MPADLGGGGVIPAVRGPADVALVRPVDGPERRPRALEDGDEGRQVVLLVDDRDLQKKAARRRRPQEMQVVR